MDIVAGAVLSVSLELLSEKLSSSNVLKFARQEHIQKELKIWERKLLEMSEVLNDAEEKQIAKQSVKEWLSDLRDLTYDMEDVLDEFSYEALRRRLETESRTSSKVRKFIPTCCGPVQAILNVKMGSKIMDLNMRLDDIYARKSDLGLDKVAAITHSTWEKPLTTSSLVHEPGVFGRDADKQNIMDMLLKDGEPNQTDTVSVVSIVAMGGTGKTTLARLVYDDDKITNHFNLKAWACVSDPFDVVRVSNTILNDFTSGSSTDSRELNQIQENLREALKGKNFLLVLDDVWIENYSDWDYLRSPFWSGAHGSKILITTRNKNVAMMMGGDKNLYKLRHLSDDDCWTVFQNHAFGNKNVYDHPNLVLIGKEIVKKCGGLPLAARALGGLLRHENREDRWNIVLNNLTLDLPGDHNSNILLVLKLSYNVLPSPLKRCFGYCAIFPQDYEFDKEELIHMWMAEGFIQHSESNRRKIEMEDLGDDYFQELLSRSFFQLSSSAKSSFVMHDLIHDLAKFVAAEICFSLQGKLQRNQQVISKKYRHSSFICGDKYDVFNRFENFYGMEEHLRTFVALSISAQLGSNEIIEALIPKFKCLRVLSLSSYEIYVIPDSIDDLNHLRYLNLSKTRVKRLPESIGKLYMLQTLIVSMCSNLTRLPLSIQNLNSLRYLDITDTPLEEMPPQISKLKSLQMSTFIVGKKNSSIKELRNTSNRRGNLHISKLENVIHVRDARAASVITRRLKNLRMSWSDSENAGKHLEVLEALQPHLGLIELQIEGYGGRKFPVWLEDNGFTEMVEIKLVNCKNCEFLPRLGQLPELKHLEIQGMDEVKSVGEEFHGGSAPFPKLESLTFSNMLQWAGWESPSTSLSYPHLLRLAISDCPKLIEELPTYLPSLVDLDIRRCPLLKSLPGGLMMQPAHDSTSSSSDGRKPSLKVLKIRECSSLKFLYAGKFPSTLEELSIGGCNQLESISEMFDNNNSLEVLDIGKYPCLRVIPDCLYNLQALYIGNCENLERLPSQLQNLRVLSICKCHNLEGLPDQMQNLLDLRIADCMKLKGLPHQMQNLRELRIEDCLEVELEPQGVTALTSLKIESTRIRLQGLNELLPSLKELTIDGKNSEITSFSDGPLLLPTTLTSLTIYDFKNLISLDSLSLQTLTSLQGLYIHDCPKLESFCPEEGLPSMLSLDIRGCPLLEKGY